eukprot:COSAG04_NODE_623_length_11808_cov_2.965838_3_plen_154_part_00
MAENRRETDAKKWFKSLKNAKSDTSFPCLPQDCAAGRGDQYIEHGGYTWRTLDGADPEGGVYGAPNGGCQGTSNYLPLPAGWVLAPNDATSRAVAAAHRWSTACAVLADGTSWQCGGNDNPGDSCISGINRLATSGGTYTVTGCNYRVLARCG